MQETLKDIKEQMQEISLVAHEASEERHTREKKNLCICFTIIILAIILVLVMSNVTWIAKFKSMGKVVENTTTETITESAVYEDIEQNADGGGNNVIGGDINGYAENT